MMETIASEFDRLPPHSVEAEMCAIASLMLIGNDEAAWADAAAMLTRGSWFQADHQIVWEALQDLHARGKAIDAVVLREELSRRQLLDEIGGVPYLAKLLATVPSSAHWRHYAAIVREKALLRGVIRIANDAIRDCYAPSEDDVAAKIAMRMAGDAAALASTGRADEVRKLEDIVIDVMASKEPKAKPDRVPTGYPDIDLHLGGLRLGSHTLVAGKPGMGKSIMLKCMARRIAMMQIPVGYITVEESEHKVGENLISVESGINASKVSWGNLGEEEWEPLNSAVCRLGKLPVWVTDKPYEISRICAMATLMAARYGCKAIMVDHIHIIDGPKSPTRDRELSRISLELKQTWKKLGVAGVVAAQLNRTSGKERPTLTALRDSGSLEQDADVVMFLHREDYYRKMQESSPFDGFDHVVEILVEKNKDGPKAVVSLRFDGSLQTIEEV